MTAATRKRQPFETLALAMLVLAQRKSTLYLRLGLLTKHEADEMERIDAVLRAADRQLAQRALELLEGTQP